MVSVLIIRATVVSNCNSDNSFGGNATVGLVVITLIITITIITIIVVLVIIGFEVITLLIDHTANFISRLMRCSRE